jgi:2,3-bisphosphoglycerate-dependent phosphoglycerate mutase
VIAPNDGEARSVSQAIRRYRMLGLGVIPDVTSEDNERGAASGWAHSRLSALGREQAQALGARRRDDALDAVFSSDLRRAAETAEIAFAESDLPVLLDWRLHECDYGLETQAPVDRHLAERCRHIDMPYPNGESWTQAVQCVGRFLDDLPSRWSGCRVLVIGHVATRCVLDHLINGVSVSELCAADFAWQEGWEYRLA